MRKHRVAPLIYSNIRDRDARNLVHSVKKKFGGPKILVTYIIDPIVNQEGVPNLENNKFQNRFKAK